MLANGYFRLGRLARVELRLHWSVPLGAVIIGSLRFEPLLWLGFISVILVHELGHAALVKGMGFQVVGIDLTGIGGQCRWRGSAGFLERAWIAWGGVLAQSVLLLGTLAVTAYRGPPTTHSGALLGQAFVDVNLWIIAINLLPLKPFDGADAWALFRELKLAGFTPGAAFLYPAWRWAQRRRQGRQQHSAPDGARPSAGRPARQSAAPTQVTLPEEPAITPPEGDDDTVVEPSAQAQRELAALLERIGKEAGKAKRRRD